MCVSHWGRCTTNISPYTAALHFYHLVFSPGSSSVWLSESVTALYLDARNETGCHRQPGESCRLMLNSSSRHWSCGHLWSSESVLENFGYPLCGWVSAQVFCSTSEFIRLTLLDKSSALKCFLYHISLCISSVADCQPVHGVLYFCAC